MPGRVLTNDGNDGSLRAPRIVKTGYSVGKARTQVEKGHRRPVEDPSKTIGRARADPLEEAEDGLYARLAVKGSDKRYLRRPRVGKTDIDTIQDSRLQHKFSAVHRPPGETSDDETGNG
jgi:hypothetical protein